MWCSSQQQTIHHSKTYVLPTKWIGAVKQMKWCDRVHMAPASVYGYRPLISWLWWFGCIFDHKFAFHLFIYSFKDILTWPFLQPTQMFANWIEKLQERLLGYLVNYVQDFEIVQFQAYSIHGLFFRNQISSGLFSKFRIFVVAFNRSICILKGQDAQISPKGCYHSLIDCKPGFVG